MEKELPKNWIQCNLFEIANVITGKKDANHSTENGIYTFFTCAYEPLKSDDYDYDDEVLILPGNGANVGEVFYFKGKFQAYQRTYIVEKIKVNPKYLYYYFLSNWRLRNENEQFGTATNYIKIGNFKSYTLEIAPLAEQNRIVEKLDRFFAQLEAINNSIKELNNIANRFTYTCLVDFKSGTYYAREKIGGFLEEGKERIGDNWRGLRLIGVSSKQGIIDLRIGQKETFEKYKIVKPGDFIYNTMRVNIGSIAIYEGTEDALTSPDYVVFRVKKYLSSQLLINFLKSDQGLLEIGTNTKGSVRARLYFTALSEVRMPIAPLEIQKLAEEFLKVFSNSLNILNNNITVKLDKLSKSILNKAFKGELSEQLESDGDARALLEEILALKSLDKKE